MTLLFLLIAGIVMLGHGAGFAGIVTLFVAILPSHDTRRFWAIIVGICLILSGTWFFAGVVGLLLGLLDDRK